MDRVIRNMIRQDEFHISESFDKGGKNDILLFTRRNVYKLDYDDLEPDERFDSALKAGYDGSDRVLCTVFTGRDSYTGTLFIVHENSQVESISIKSLKDSDVYLDINESDIIAFSFIPNDDFMDIQVVTDKDKTIVFNSSLLMEDSESMVIITKLLTGGRSGNVVSIRVLDYYYPDLGKYRVNCIPSLGYYMEQDDLRAWKAES